MSTASKTKVKRIIFHRLPDSTIALANPADARHCRSFGFDLPGNLFFSHSERLPTAIVELMADGFEVVFRAVN